MLKAPCSLVGEILFLWLRGSPLSEPVAVTFLRPFGVAVMCGVLVDSEINRRMRFEEGAVHVVARPSLCSLLKVSGRAS